VFVFVVDFVVFVGRSVETGQAPAGPAAPARTGCRHADRAAALPMRLRRLLNYGLVGWALEVGFTGVMDGLKLRDPRLRGHSYLWMLPIYGAGGLVVEELHRRLVARGLPRPVRALAYTGVIYLVEGGTGALLQRLTGRCPWKYEHGLNIRGYVRLDYFPFWYALGWAVEAVQEELAKLQRPRRRGPRAALSADRAALASMAVTTGESGEAGEAAAGEAAVA
jgi:hypothetical protein